MEHENIIRLTVFIGLFTVLALVETQIPRRSTTRARRWVANWGLVIIDSIALRLVAYAMPLLAVGAATHAAAGGFGVLNWLSLPTAFELIIAILVLDLAIWTQHMITHKVPFLWRLHQVHHADTEMDVTTAIRFHPLEIVMSMVLKIGLVYILGPSAVAVIMFEIMLNGTAMFNHSNIRLPLSFDAILRRVLVTPDMHRVHHSVHRNEHDSNYGFSLSIWDRMFNTYIAQPAEGHDDMKIGLSQQDERPSRLGWLLTMPFRPFGK